MDVDALESNTFLGAKYAKKVGKGGVASPKAKTTKADEGDEVIKKKRRKKRKKRLPKDYNPDVDPDPERWLPRRERTGYRKSRSVSMQGFATSPIMPFLITERNEGKEKSSPGPRAPLLDRVTPLTTPRRRPPLVGQCPSKPRPRTCPWAHVSSRGSLSPRKRPRKIGFDSIMINSVKRFCMFLSNTNPALNDPEVSKHFETSIKQCLGI